MVDDGKGAVDCLSGFLYTAQSVSSLRVRLNIQPVVLLLLLWELQGTDKQQGNSTKKEVAQEGSSNTKTTLSRFEKDSLAQTLKVVKHIIPNL